MARAKLTEEQRNIHSQVHAHRSMQATNVATHEAMAGITTRNTLEREHLHSQQRIETEGALAGARQSRANDAAMGEARSRVITSAPTPSSDSGLIMTTLFVMAGLCVVYLLVHNSTQTEGFLGSATTWMHGLSSSTSLFHIVPKPATTS